MMKKFLPLIFILSSFSLAYGQDYCDNIQVVGVHDFPPSPKTPGGNFFVLLLTLKEDNLSTLDNYANLFFMSEEGDTISIPTGANSTLPIYAKDTIPYVLELNSTKNNQDFPEDFKGKLVIIHSLHPQCEVAHSNGLTGLDPTSIKNDIDISPNPSSGRFTIQSNDQIRGIQVFNSSGQLIHVVPGDPIGTRIELSPELPGIYFLQIETIKGRTLSRSIIKK